MSEPKTQEDVLLALNKRLSQRLNDIADMEAKSAIVGGLSSKGSLTAEKQRLISQLDKILDDLEALYA